MSFIKVTAGDLASTASIVNNASTTIQDASSTALNAVTNLTSEGWQGGGSTAAQAAIQQWQQGAAQVQEALATLSTLITQAEGTYSETDSSVASSFAS